MILRRLGNKSRIAQDIIKYFPAHKIYIEPFFGAGGMFFNKPKAKYNIVNDIDSDVFNLFQVILNKRIELSKYLENIPYHDDFWNYCKKTTPKNDIEQAVFFVVLSNFGYLGKDSCLHFAQRNHKQIAIDNIEETYKYLISGNVQFMNTDFRNVLKRFVFNHASECDITELFTYSDPPYLGTEKYQTEWTENDVSDCMDITFNSGINGAMSEFNHPFILQQSKERNLNVHIIGERQNLKNRRTEILITNYQVTPDLFSGC